MEEEEKYSFRFYAQSPVETVELVINETELFETELGLYINAFERFLKAAGFVLDNRHLELVDD